MDRNGQETSHETLALFTHISFSNTPHCFTTSGTLIKQHFLLMNDHVNSLMPFRLLHINPPFVSLHIFPYPAFCLSMPNSPPFKLTTCKYLKPWLLTMIACNSNLNHSSNAIHSAHVPIYTHDHLDSVACYTLSSDYFPMHTNFELCPLSPNCAWKMMQYWNLKFKQQESPNAFCSTIQTAPCHRRAILSQVHACFLAAYMH